MKKTNTQKTLSALDFALSQLVDEPQRADEFSSNEFFEQALKKEPTITFATAAYRIKRMVSQGALIARKTRINGKVANLYSKR
jgi:hypothetical protein